MLNLNRKHKIKYQNGTDVPSAEETTYLGTKLNTDAEMWHEISARLQKANAVWNKLNILEKHKLQTPMETTSIRLHS